MSLIEDLPTKAVKTITVSYLKLWSKQKILVTDEKKEKAVIIELPAAKEFLPGDVLLVPLPIPISSSNYFAKHGVTKLKTKADIKESVIKKLCASFKEVPPVEDFKPAFNNLVVNIKAFIVNTVSLKKANGESYCMYRGRSETGQSCLIFDFAKMNLSNGRVYRITSVKMIVERDSTFKFFTRNSEATDLGVAEADKFNDVQWGDFKLQGALICGYVNLEKENADLVVIGPDGDEDKLLRVNCSQLNVDEATFEEHLHGMTGLKYHLEFDIYKERNYLARARKM